METTVYDDLEAEYARIDAILGSLSERQWAAPSRAAGWSVSDVVLHLAQSEEFVLHAANTVATPVETSSGGTMDERMAALVEAERGTDPHVLLSRWRSATVAGVRALRAAPPGARLPWAAAPLTAPTLATTRLAEHWAHMLDVVEALGIDYPDTARLRHIAWLAHRTLPYALAISGQSAGAVRCELAGPSGERWEFGDTEAPNVIRGSAGEFCRVAAQRARPEATGLHTTGPDAARALQVVRTYAA